MITVTKLTKHYGSTQALKEVSFEIQDNALLAITGKSGSGKSTLLALLGGLEKPSSGDISIDKNATTSMSERNLTRFRRQHVGFVFQSFNLVPNLSALDNVMLPMEFAKVKARERRTRAKELLEQVGITGSRQKHLPGRLSGGEQQRVAIARALANRPNIILADEPTGNLDSENSARIFKLLQSLHQMENAAIIIVTHDMALANKCDQRIVLKDGLIYSTQGNNAR